MGRPPIALLSRETILAAAFRLVDEGRSFGMRQLARELGVSTPSLYNHVAGIDDLIEIMRMALGDDGQPHSQELRTLSWADRIRQIAMSVHNAYASHPRFIPFLLGTPISSPRITESYEILAEAIAETGCDPQEVRTRIDQIDSLALGTAIELLTTDDIWRDATPGGALDIARRSWDSSRQRLDHAFSSALELILLDMSTRPSPHGSAG